MRVSSFNFSILLVLLVTSSTSVDSLDESLWKDSDYGQHEVQAARRDGRAIWLPGKHNPECTGGVITLFGGDETNVSSHKSYGHNPYPSEYQCRWLLLPMDCDMGLVCDLGTQDGRSLLGQNSQDGCSKAGDFLRVEGYDGAYDVNYCGRDKISIKVQSSLVLSFVSQLPRTTSKKEERVGFLQGFLQGFGCKVQCVARPSTTTAANETTTTTQPTTTTETTTTATTTTVKTSTRSPSSQIPFQFLESRRCKCGERREGRIVCPFGFNNCEARRGSIPWQASLVFRGKYQPWCGGTLISDRYVLTAAHCLSRKSARSLQVVLGDHDWTTRVETPEIRRGVEEIIRHPKFGENATFDHDYALLRLSVPVNYNTHGNIRPACLPDRERAADELTGLTGTASGWGVVDPKDRGSQADKLQTTDVNIISHSDCRNSYPVGSVTPSMFCAKAKGSDACFGDSGGPFTVVREGGPSVLEGVVSWGRSCGKPHWPGVYARVGKVLDWIDENTRDSTFCSRDDAASH